MYDGDGNKVHRSLRDEGADGRQKLEHLYVRICAPNDYGERGNLCAYIREQYSRMLTISNHAPSRDPTEMAGILDRKYNVENHDLEMWLGVGGEEGCITVNPTNISDVTNFVNAKIAM